MEISGSPPSPINLTTSLSQLQSLRVGQLLQAVVIKQLSSELVLLQLVDSSQPKPASPAQPLQLKAETPIPLATGLRLQLEVTQLGEKPILRVLNQPPPAEPPLKETLMQTLPRQSGLAPLLANLNWINQQQSAALPLPQAILILAKELFDKLPSREKISSAEGVKQAIKDSGLFLESRLGQAAQKGETPEVGSDIKALLLRLLNAVQKEQTQTTAPPLSPLTRSALPETHLMPLSPPPAIPGGRPHPQGEAQPTLPSLTTIVALLQELGRQTDGSVARSQLHQLASLPSPEQNPLIWSFELPIRNQEKIDLFQFVIEEHKGKRDENEEQQRRWSITIAFELEELGSMFTRLQLENGRVSATFWADSFDTTALINQNLPELAQRFEHVGLEHGELRCYQGEPPDSAATAIPRLVLDLKA